MGKRSFETHERLLRERARMLRADIARELAKNEQEHYSNLADRLADLGEQSVADLLVDVNLAEITRDVEELRGLEGALARLERGTYGTCTDCGVEIEPHRLDAVPAAARCLKCQVAFEARDRREHHRTL